MDKLINKETAREFYTNVIELGELTRNQMVTDMATGARPMDISEIRVVEESIRKLKEELQQYY